MDPNEKSNLTLKLKETPIKMNNKQEQGPDVNETESSTPTPIDQIRRLSMQNITDQLAELASASNESLAQSKYSLFGMSGPFIDTLAKPQLYLLWYCIVLFIQSMVVNGFINSSLATIEKRFKLSSLETSFIASAYDIGCICVVLPVSYFGNHHHKVKWIGLGSFIMGIGSFIMACPHLFAGKYEYGVHLSEEIPLCRSFMVFDNCSVSREFSSLRHYKYIFYVGHFVIGIGSSPLFTLGIAYIEQKVDVATTALYVGISTAITAIGPAVGYVLFGIFLKIYVDIVIPTSEMTPDNTDIWIGAWWLGFLIAGIAFMVFALPLIFFPRPSMAFCSSRKHRRQIGISTEELKEILQMMKNILTNLPYNCLNVATALTLLSLSGLSTYGPKYLENTFGLTASSATITTGIVTVPTLATGALVGGIILNYFEWKIEGTMVFMAVTTIMSIPLLFTFSFECELPKIAGIDVPFHNQPLNDINLTSACNVNCFCGLSYNNFRPTCGIDKKIYFSPCVAGCYETMVVNGNNVYRNCSCIPDDLKPKDGIQLFDQKCKVENCIYLYIFLTILGFFLFFTYLRGAPMVTATMRSVRKNEISLALGIQSIFSRIFGSIPGPSLFGFVIDNACIFWQTQCNRYGNCLEYDIKRYSRSFLLLMIVITSCNGVCFIVAYVKMSLIDDPLKIEY